MKNYTKKISEKFKSWQDNSQAKAWLSQNYERVTRFFSDYKLRDFILEPFKSVFDTTAPKMDKDVYSVITQVAIINAVLAGFPGKLGVGVWISMALEAWMAYSIACFVGFKINNISDIWKYFGVIAASLGIILYAFRLLLGFAFSLFSIIPAINPLIFAELLITDLVGILFWVGFSEAREKGSFSVPKRMIFSSIKQTKILFQHQFKLLKNVLSLDNIKLVGKRLKAFLLGEIPADNKIIHGEVFATAAMAYLLSGHFEKLQGPLGDTFIQAIRLRWSSQLSDDTSLGEIAEHFRHYDAEQLIGVVNIVKGKMFEIMVTDQENMDGDRWRAQMHTDESFPGSDIIFFNTDTGETLEVSLKAVTANNQQIIEQALVKYPDLPIMTTEEVAESYMGDPRVFSSTFSNEELNNITHDRLDELLTTIKPINEYQVVVGGVSMGMIATLWPFVMAYLRQKMTYGQLEKVFKHTMGDTGVMLVSRIAYASVFGPLFAWYLLARGIKGLVVMAEPKAVYYKKYVPGSIGFGVKA